jgi:hypothetical protein
MSKEIMVRIDLGSASVMFMAEGVAYNPDVADDMVRRAQQSLQYAVDMAISMGFPQGWDELDDEDACQCDIEDCDCTEGECECSTSSNDPVRQLTDREFLEKLMKGLEDGN